MAPSVPLTCTGHTAALCPMLGPLWAALPILAWETCRKLTPGRWLPLCHTWPKVQFGGGQTQKHVDKTSLTPGGTEALGNGDCVVAQPFPHVLPHLQWKDLALVLQCLVVLLRPRTKVFQKCVINLCLGRKTSSVLSYSWENDREKTNPVKMEDSVAERTQVDSLLCSLLTDSCPHQSLRASLISSCSTTL